MFIKRVQDRFNSKLSSAVKSLKWELINNRSLSRFGNYSAVNDTVTNALVVTMESMVQDPEIGVVYGTKDYEGANSKVELRIKGFSSEEFPQPLMGAILYEETGLRWFRPDGYPTIGLDFNDKSNPERITSRGFFVSQRTLFKYPVDQSRIDSMDSLDEDLNFFSRHLENKYKKYIVSSKPSVRDDLRLESFSKSELRGCKYSPDDSKYMIDCKNCVEGLKRRDYPLGVRLAKGSSWKLRKTRYHKRDGYKNMPDFKEFPCDYLFAIRRYNGGGINSFHYLMQVLEHLRDK